MKSLVIVVLLASFAFAQPVTSPVPRPQGLTLPHRTLSATLTLEAGLNKEQLGEPVSIAPDISYGVSDALTLSLVQSRFATTGFRAAGGGVCMTGSDAGCPQIYNNLGVEALWSLLRGPTSVAVGGGAFAMDFDKGYYAAKLAARGRYTAGAFSMQLSPSVLIALTEREDAMGNRANKDALYIPLMATYKPIPVLWLSLASGFKGPLDDLGDAWEIPGGVVMQYVFNPSVSVGGSYVFPKLVGAADEPPAPAPPATGFDYRRFNVWVTLTQGI